MSLYFITGNPNKLKEAQAILPAIEGFALDLPEIQELDPKVIIQAKLTEALKHKDGELIVEDTSLHLDALQGLPGPLIKWFLTTLGAAGLYSIADTFGAYGATARVMLGYAKHAQEIHFFEGTLRGTLVPPRGDTSFGWDPVFQPAGHTKTFAEMSTDEKNTISHRSIAFKELKRFLLEKA